MTLNTSHAKLNIGLIGCGGRLRTVMKAILDEAPPESIRVGAVYDPDPGSREALCQELGYQCKNQLSEEALVNDPEIDWVFIGSWNCHHARQAILAMNAGKHVFCEKPLAISLEECLAIKEVARKSERIFAFGLVLRYSPHYQQIMEVIRSGALGKSVSFEFNETLDFNHGGYIFGNWRRERRYAGTHMLEKCCHDLDLANWIIGSLPVRVASFGGKNFFERANAGQMERIGLNEKGQQAYCTWLDPHRINPFDEQADIFDNQVVILQYANGVRGTFHTNCNAGLPERRFYICGTEGALRADLISGIMEIRRIGWDTEIERIDTGAKGGHGGGDEEMGRAMVETLLCGKAPLASIEEGIQSAVVAFGIDRSADEGCTVDLYPAWKQAMVNPLKPGDNITQAQV